MDMVFYMEKFMAVVNVFYMIRTEGQEQCLFLDPDLRKAQV